MKTKKWINLGVIVMLAVLLTASVLCVNNWKSIQKEKLAARETVLAALDVFMKYRIMPDTLTERFGVNFAGYDGAHNTEHYEFYASELEKYAEEYLTQLKQFFYYEDSPETNRAFESWANSQELNLRQQANRHILPAYYAMTDITDESVKNTPADPIFVINEDKTEIKMTMRVKIEFGASEYESEQEYRLIKVDGKWLLFDLKIAPNGIV